MRASRIVLLVLLAAGCNNDPPNLTVDLETDLVPGVDFDHVTVEVAPPSYTSTSLAPGAVTTPAVIGTYVPGRRVAEVHGVAVGDHLVRVRLVERDGTMVVQRLIRLQIQSTYSLIVIVTRDCAGITCPQPDGDPTFTSCVAGVCTNPTCSPEHPEACPHPSCTVASDCSPTSPCVHPVCDEGQCLQVAVDTDCPAHQRCDGTLGCVDVGGAPDAGTSDACASAELACTNGMDDDCDGHTDCGDADCAGTTCDDGQTCTATDQCTGGACAGTPISCDDGVACTVDACAEPTGCTHTPTDALCTAMAGGHCDLAAGCQYPTCTCGAGSTCCAGACHSTACDDGNPCTNDTFDTATCACAHANNAATCNDGNACTTGDHCAAGRCAGAARDCDDGNACTTDACNASSGCTHADRANGTSCNGGACCGGSCVSLATRSHCGSCGATCAGGQSCVTVPGRSGVHTCTCGSNAECRGEGFGGMATCFSGYCDCQCAAAEPTTCNSQCSSGATCHELSGHNYCQYP